MTNEMDIDIGKVFNRKNLKNVFLISLDVDPFEVLDMYFVATRRIPIDDFKA